MTRQELQDMTAKLCGVLSELGFEYEFEADNRASNKSHYIYVRRPTYMEIRLSDHAMNKVKRRKRFDIGPHGITLDQATAAPLPNEWEGLSAADVIHVLTGTRPRRRPLPAEGSPALAWLTWFFDDERHADTIIKALREEGFEILRRPKS